ncbi:MAG TPA: hypothetical protein VFA18_11145, partial [Gemmataceae bacterium]|nr:hypothetical protein [Gemmataceae bacterium]
REALDLHDVLSAHELAVLGENAAPRAGANRIWKPLMANMRRELDQALRNAPPSLIASARGTPTATESRSPPRNSLTTSARTTDSRLPVPGEKERVKILADLHQRYAQRYGSSDSRQRSALAQEFLRQGRDEATEQVSRYVLLQEAGKLAAGAESLTTALEAINQLGANYAVNALELKASSVEAAAAGLRRPSRALVFVPLAATVAEELTAADRYQDAARVLAATEKGARVAGQPATVRLVAAQREFVQQLAEEWEKLKSARMVLRQVPTDPGANESVGRFLCLAKGDWGAGLALLGRGKGGDLPLQNAAKLDLSRPDTGSARRELADGYRRLSDQADGVSKLQLARRAVHWYRAALLSDLSSSQAPPTLEDIHRLEKLPGFRPPEIPGSCRRLPHPEESLTCLAVAPDGLTLATGATGEPIRLYDPDSGRKLRDIQRARGFSLSGLAFNATGQKILAYDSRGVLDVWDSQSGARDTAYRPTIGPLKHAVWAGSDTIITAGTSTWFQRLAADGSNEIKRLPNRIGNINCLAASADGRWIALGTTNGVVEIYTANQPTLIVALPHPRGAAEALAFTPDGKHLVVAYADRALVRWDVKRSTHAQLLARSTTPVQQLAVSGDGRRIVWTSGDRLLHYADARSRKELLRLDSFGKPIKGIAWMPDGQHALSADEDGTILLWSLPGD